MQGEFSFLDTIATNLEAVVADTDTIRVPEEYFEANFVPYLSGEKHHPNIMTKILELTNNGLSTISLIDKEGNVSTVLPSVFPRTLDASEKFEQDFHKANNKMIPQAAEHGVREVMEHHLKITSNHSWDKYLAPFRDAVKGVNTPNEEDDDDDFEIIY